MGNRSDYERAMERGVEELFSEICDKAKFPRDVTGEAFALVLDGIRQVMRTHGDSVDWDGLMRDMTPDETAEATKISLREPLRRMMAAEGLLPN